MKNIFRYVTLLLCMSLVLCGCGGTEEKETTPTEPAAVQQTEVVTEPVETTEPTEPAPVYETRTVYLCTLETMTQYESGAVFKTAYAYDEHGRKIEKWRIMEDGSKGQVSVFAYDENGNNTFEYYEQSSHYEMTYDAEGRLLSKLYYYGEECDMEYYYTYNEDGYVVKEVRITRYAEEKNDTYELTYDEDYSESVINHYFNGEKTGYTKETYNERGQVLSSDNYDLNGNWRSGSKYEYDEEGKQTMEWRYSSSETQADYDTIFTYDENGLLISKNVDYYYGHLIEYTYEPFEILVRVK